MVMPRPTYGHAWAGFTGLACRMRPAGRQLDNADIRQSRTSYFIPNCPLVSHFEFTLYSYHLTPGCFVKTGSTVHNTLHCCQRRTEPWLQAMCTEKLVKFGLVISEICEQTDRHRQAHCNTFHHYWSK